VNLGRGGRGYEAEYDDDDEEIVEVEVYENEHYSRETDTDMRSCSGLDQPTGNHKTKAEMTTSHSGARHEGQGDFEDSKMRIRR